MEEATEMPNVSRANPPKKATKKKKSGATINDLILTAVSATKDRAGISTHALKKELGAQGYDVANNNVYIKRGIKWLLSKGAIVHTKGSGAVGSFKAGKNAAAVAAAIEAAARKSERYMTEKTAAEAKKIYVKNALRGSKKGVKKGAKKTATPKAVKSTAKK
ncbi:histone H1-like [Plectropomus leopardus]|uniref:histone H1-like n=1 Tax=Plectropomus leopardus TaxID=160734 RepID=UPI001C4C70DA|nr:histone H1-like [Plectropomus leopardus]